MLSQAYILCVTIWLISPRNIDIWNCVIFRAYLVGLSSDSSLAEAFKIGGKGTGVVQLMAHITVPLCLSNKKWNLSSKMKILHFHLPEIPLDYCYEMRRLSVS